MNFTPPSAKERTKALDLALQQLPAGGHAQDEAGVEEHPQSLGEQHGGSLAPRPLRR